MIDSPSLLKILPTTTFIFSFHCHLPRSRLSTHFLYRKRTLCYFHVHRFMNIYWWAVFTARRCASAVYMPRPCVRLCPSVCLSQVGVLSKRQERIELGFGKGSSFLQRVLHCVIRKVEYFQKRTSLWNFAQKSGLIKHNKSIFMSTVLVDGRACELHLRRSTRRCWTHVVYYTSVDCNSLTPLFLFVQNLFVRLVPSAVQRLTNFWLTQRVARSVCGSRASFSWCRNIFDCNMTMLILSPPLSGFC